MRYSLTMVVMLVRRFHKILKLLVIGILVVTIFVTIRNYQVVLKNMQELRPWMRRFGGSSQMNATAEEYQNEMQVAKDESHIVAGLGEGGAPASLIGRGHDLREQADKLHAFNLRLSDMIAYNRTLKDSRNPACKDVVYDAELPSASVVIIFHNEPYSVLVRTIWSVVTSARRDRPWFKQANYYDIKKKYNMTLGYPGQDPSSPLVYLKEIILVDDNSTLPELKGKLSHYVRTRLPPDIIQIKRLGKHKGVVGARLAGARYAGGDVLVFLDAHCEVQPDWLRPLLQRIKDAPHAVVMPIIDTLHEYNFRYSGHPTKFQVGGFTFAGHSTWIDVSERETRRRGSDIAPTWSPTMAGGMFAVNHEYFWELGGYDELMQGRGGEDLEISFRIWQCGGTLEVMPCSRVGHVFTDFQSRATLDRPPVNSDSRGINTARTAEVWMDEYKDVFYLHRPDLRNSSKVGDVSHCKLWREQLQCKSFEWYLQHVYREKFVPVRDAFGYGRFHNEATDMCVDTLQKIDYYSPLGVYPCHATLQTSQFLTLTLDGQLRDEMRCAELHYLNSGRLNVEEGEREGILLMAPCDKQNPRQLGWRYTKRKQLMHLPTGLCLSVGELPEEGLRARRCHCILPAGVAGVTGEVDTAAAVNTSAESVAATADIAPTAVPLQSWQIEYTDLNASQFQG